VAFARLVKTRTIIFGAAGLLLMLVAAVPYLVHRSVRSRIGQPHTFTLPESPRFLTEELALAKARDTLNRDGYDVAVWQPMRDGRTTAPDGRTDEFMARNTINPNDGAILFTNITASPRFVSVRLNGSQVVCRTSIAK
jgi:hypothetical protein